MAPPRHDPTPANTNEQQGTTETRTVQDTVENVLDKLISPQETQGCQSGEIQSSCTGYEPRANPATSSSATRELGDTLTQLLEASLSTTSLSTYRRPWFLYRQFSAEKLHL